MNMRKTSLLTFLLSASIAVVAYAANQYVNTTIATVSVTGGADTANPGVSCIRIHSATVPSCNNGFIAIRNNNKQLLAAAMTAKTANSNVWLYYDDAGPEGYHCPGQIFTPCSVVSIELQ